MNDHSEVVEALGRLRRVQGEPRLELVDLAGHAFEPATDWSLQLVSNDISLDGARDKLG